MSKLFKFMAKAGLITAIVVGLLIAVMGVAFANGQETCPTGLGWTKVEAPDSTINGTTISFSIPVDKIVTAVCVKASTNIYNWTGIATAHFSWNIGGQYDVSHYSYYMIDDEYEPCDETTGFQQVGDPILVATWPNGTKVYSVVYINYDARDQETVCGRRAQIVIVPPEADKCIHTTGWVDIGGGVYVKYDLFDQEVVCDRKKDKPCVKEEVFYWSDGFCMIRQRGGPIGGQQRPFMPMQDTYCGCGYAHEEGWDGFYAVSDCKGEGEEYTYWNELPLFCGAQSCE